METMMFNGIAKEKSKPVYKNEVVWTNCSDQANGHTYELVSNKELIKQIRLRHPALTHAIWRCVKCLRVKQST